MNFSTERSTAEFLLYRICVAPARDVAAVGSSEPINPGEICLRSSRRNDSQMKEFKTSNLRSSLFLHRTPSPWLLLPVSILNERQGAGGVARRLVARHRLALN